MGRYQSNVARDVLDTILSIQPKDSGGGGETRETVVYRLAEEFLSKLPRNYVDFEVNCTNLCQNLCPWLLVQKVLALALLARALVLLRIFGLRLGLALPNVFLFCF